MQSIQVCSIDQCQTASRCLGLCESHYNKSRYKPRLHSHVCTECGSGFVARNLRRGHCYELSCVRSLQARKAREGEWSKKHRELHGRPAGTIAADDRRKALIRGATAVGANFVRKDVFDRDGWSCGICGEPVDPEVLYPDPLSASVDHVVPISRGGVHSFENVRCTHLTCNVRRQAG